MSGISSLVTQVSNPNEFPNPPTDEEEDKDPPVVHESKGCLESVFCCFSWCWSRPKHGQTAGGSGAKQESAPPNPLPPTPVPPQPAPPTPPPQPDQPLPSQNDVQVDQKEFQQPPVKLLGDLHPDDTHKKTLVLDLDETLVHSSFKPIPNADFVISIELDNVIHRVYVLKRPGVDNFLRHVGQKFEVVVFTASLAKYADPLLDILDRGKVVRTRLFREACVQHYGNYVKDLSHLGRRLEDTIIIDNSPFSYMFQPDNAIPIISWFNDKNDRQLYDLLPFLDSLLEVDDVSTKLQRRKTSSVSGPSNNLQTMA